MSVTQETAAQAGRRYPHITDEELARAQGLVGVILRRPLARTLASHDTLIGYARAIGSRIPLFTDAAHGLRTYWGCLLGHPTSLYCFDNTVVAPALPGIHSIYAGCHWRWEQPVRLGAAITATAVLANVTRKSGSFAGDMVLQEGRVEYRDGDGRLVATARPRVLRTPRDEARARGKYRDVEVYRYSAAEFDAIIDAYQAEEIRGERPLYFEEVEAGEKLPALVKGPVTSEDMGMFVGSISQTLFFSDFLDHWRRHPADVYWSPDTRAPDWWDASLVRDEVAQEFGFPLAHDTGSQRVAWIENCVSNWAGDFSFLRELDVTLHRPCFRGDATWVSGEVTGKRRAGRAPSERFEVTCSLTAVNQRGEVTASGQAVVQVVSKETDTIPPVLRLPDDYDPFRGLPR